MLEPEDTKNPDHISTPTLNTGAGINVEQPSGFGQQLAKEEQEITNAQIQLEEADTVITQDIADDTLSSSLDKSNTTNNDFIYPLRTRRLELQNFFNRVGSNGPNYLMEPAFKTFLEGQLRVGSDSEPPGYKLKLNSVQAIIPKMSFDMYWDFRNYQIQNMQEDIQKQLDLLERLRLHPDEHNELQEQRWLKFFKKRPGIADTFEARKAYFEKIRDLYAGVSIEAVMGEDGKTPVPDTRKITKNGKTLVTIEKDHGPAPYNNYKNNIVYKIDPSLTGKELDDAIKIMIDQTTRKQESSRSNKLEISGYKNNPETALKIYHLAFLQGARPTIHPETLDAWEKKAGPRDNQNPTPEQIRFQKAIKYLDKFQKPAAKNSIARVNKLIKRNPALLSAKPAIEDTPIDPPPSSPHYKKPP